MPQPSNCHSPKLLFELVSRPEFYLRVPTPLGATEWLRGSALATPPFWGSPIYLPRYHVLGGVVASVVLLWVLQKLIWLRCVRPESLRDRRSRQGVLRARSPHLRD